MRPGHSALCHGTFVHDTLSILSSSRGGSVCGVHCIDKETVLGTQRQASNPVLWTQNPVLSALPPWPRKSLPVLSPKG